MADLERSPTWLSGFVTGIFGLLYYDAEVAHERDLSPLTLAAST
jgi:hypothetical protein